jgi:hypothetical protein
MKEKIKIPIMCELDDIDLELLSVLKKSCVPLSIHQIKVILKFHHVEISSMKIWVRLSNLFILGLVKKTENGKVYEYYVDSDELESLNKILTHIL